MTDDDPHRWQERYEEACQHLAELQRTINELRADLAAWREMARGMAQRLPPPRRRGWWSWR
jgi:hypothetical protein